MKLVSINGYLKKKHCYSIRQLIRELVIPHPSLFHIPNTIKQKIENPNYIVLFNVEASKYKFNRNALSIVATTRATEHWIEEPFELRLKMLQRVIYTAYLSNNKELKAIKRKINKCDYICVSIINDNFNIQYKKFCKRTFIQKIKHIYSTIMSFVYDYN